MSSEEEFDYMSDAFLQATTTDIRPGLIVDRKIKRQIELDKKKEAAIREEKEKNKPLKVLQEEKLSEGLETPLSTDNKGFAMMAKMGFNPGTGLGAKGEGRKEPIMIEIKKDKQGLGRYSEIKELLQLKRQQLKAAQNNALSVKDFRASVSAKANESRCARDLWKSQKTCHMLDTDEGILEPSEPWFWPKVATKEDEEKEESDSDDDEKEIELPVEDKLELITIYLRRTYYYCVWCGTKYNDEEDLRDSCPGATHEEH